VQIHCRYDVFDGLSEAFRGNHNVFVEITKKDGSMVFSSTRDEDDVLSSTLSIKKSERCETQISHEIDELRVSLSLGDFIVAVKIVKILNQRMSIYLVGPGFPVIIKSALPNQVQFEMPLATALDQDAEEETHEELTTSQSSSVQEAPQVDSQSSQVSPWPRKRSVETERGVTDESPPLAARARTLLGVAAVSPEAQDDRAGRGGVAATVRQLGLGRVSVKRDTALRNMFKCAERGNANKQRDRETCL
jgi:hypothetical protein